MLRVELRMALRTHELDVQLDATAEQPLALVGRSGAGKTTVLRVIAGLARPDSGRVRCGDDVWLDSERGTARPPDARRCALLHQEDALFPHLSAWRNVAYGLREVRRGARREAARELLAQLGVAALADVRPAAMSGGERRRVALARALAAAPPALLLDEPFTGLDDRSRDDAHTAVLRALELAAVPTIVVTHDHRDAAALGAEVRVLENGRLLPHVPTGRSQR
ncbi:ATP-binding cassette domain-containing protein [Paraconexibacter algicola]|uniref:ABC transporter n=1 Tax=Paraconexibacter algicola TaxID=2133960 RepID=A0A2T4UCJ9_9ACTN|nr:ATP-binding cassette domain-containing protein [Paraconexibacter algicola]PTL54946.1 ABC transporter [Paraconexibacter algicola]